MEKMNGQSADIVADNIDQLKALFPEAFTEGKVSFDVLKQLLGGAVDEREEKYGLNWHGKKAARQIALTPSNGTLRPCPEESVDWDATRNLMIEGDNLEVLKLLQKSYSGKVKLIYIDPPYNTGKDFVYPDDFHDNIKNYLDLTGQIESGKKISSNTEASGRFHTNWLSMMFPRLRLARDLLLMDGVILISIDDHEVENVRRLCSEIFGEENFIACMTWEKGRKNDAKLISVGHEYIVIYAKSLARLKEQKTIWREEKPGAREIWDTYISLRARLGENDSDIEKELQKWFSSLPKSHPSKKWSRYKHIDKHGPWRDDNISWPGGGGPTYDVIHPITKLPCKVPERGWVFAQLETMLARIKAGIVEFRDDHTEPPIRKSHLRPIDFEATEFDDEEIDSDVDIDEDSDEDELATQVRGTYFYQQAQVTIKFMRKLMGPKVFNNPKDHYELARLFNYVTSTSNDAIVMDFFAGSGSTAHSVMELNKNDQGKRRFILVQLPEVLDPKQKEQKPGAAFCDKLGKPRTIAELTKERLRRSGQNIVREVEKIAKENQNKKDLFASSHEPVLDLGFRVFKLDSSNIRTWDPDRDNLEQTLLDNLEHIKPGRRESDILYELLLKLGLDLCVPIETRSVASKNVQAIGAGVLLTCLAESITREEVESLALGIIAWHKELAPAGDTTCVFRDSAFADDVAKSNLSAILFQYGIENVRSL
jgi:adenine-specific DNA-methyltransferase